MTQEGFKRKLTAILSADVEGYSRLMDDDEEATVRTLSSYRTAIADLVQQFRGRIVDNPGDNILTDFTSVVDAVNCAVEIQQDLAERNAKLPDNRQMQFRIGVNLGDVIEDDGRIYGDGVNIAARVEGLAEAGGVCISGSVYDQVENKLDFKCDYMGEQAVKNISKPVRVYRILTELDEGVLILGKKIEFPDKPSIAVLPFVNMSGDSSQEYFSDGLTEQIITGISKIPGLFVIARNSAFAYKGQAVRVQRIGQELGVKHILEGSVQKAGDRVRINAQLIDTSTERHLWAESYDRVLKDIFAIQDDITIQLIKALHVKLIGGEQSRYYMEGTENINAFIKMLQGTEYFYRLTAEDNLFARDFWEEAINLDQNYSLPCALLALSHHWDYGFGWSKSPLESFELAEKMAKKALSLNDSTELAHQVLSFNHVFKHQHDKAIERGEQALVINPNNADSYASLSIVYSFSGMPEKAISLLEKAFRLNPVAPANYYSFLAVAYRMTKQYAEAIKAYHKSLQISPDFFQSHMGLAVCYVATGNIGKAQNALAEALKLNPNLSLDFVPIAAPFKDQSNVEFIVESLRKAGLK